MVARNSLPPKDLTELIEWLKQNPGKVTAGTVGVGGASDITGTYFQNVTGTKFVFVPYRGAAPLNQDLVAGHIDINLGMAAAGYPLMRNGQIKAYATMAKSRWWAAPEIPTMEEAGVPGLYASFWHGLWVPGNTEGGDRTPEFCGAVRLSRPGGAPTIRRSGPGNSGPGATDS
jgi:tripartite-type tricarboxylate transporter receptor subunit TctC